MTNDDPPSIHVKIAVAVSEAGTVRLAVADSNWIQEERKHQQMLAEIRADKQLWSLRYLTTAVPYPHIKRGSTMTGPTDDELLAVFAIQLLAQCITE